MKFVVNFTQFVINFGKFINFGLGTVTSEKIKQPFVSQGFNIAAGGRRTDEVLISIYKSFSTLVIQLKPRLLEYFK